MKCTVSFLVALTALSLLTPMAYCSPDIFGYSSPGANSQAIEEVITGSWFNLPVGGRIDKFYVYCGTGSYPQGTPIKGVIYLKSDNSCIAETASHWIPAFDASSWHELQFTQDYEDKALMADDYILMITSQYTVDIYYTSDEQKKGYQRNWVWDWEDTFPDPLPDAGLNTRKYSIYVTYTPMAWHDAETWWGYLGTLTWLDAETWFGLIPALYSPLGMLRIGLFIAGAVCFFTPMVYVGYRGRRIGMGGAISTVLCMGAGIGLFIGFASWV